MQSNGPIVRCVVSVRMRVWTRVVVVDPPTTLVISSADVIGSCVRCVEETPTCTTANSTSQQSGKGTLLKVQIAHW